MLQNASYSPIGNTSCAPVEKKVVVINGQSYPVTKAPVSGFGFGIAQQYKEVVTIDGQQYDVHTTNDPMACDKTKQVVVVNGQQYDVKNEGQAMMETGLQNIADSIFNAIFNTNK